jgi:hypothetical protein
MQPKSIQRETLARHFGELQNSDTFMSNYSYDRTKPIDFKTDNQSRYKEQLGYDANGIKFLQRWEYSSWNTKIKGAIDTQPTYTGKLIDKVTTYIKYRRI